LCGSRTKVYFVDYREGCDTEVHVEFWAAGSDDSLYDCDEPPTVTITAAP
jgi:hypothetical protein